MTVVMMTKFVDAGKNRRYLVEDALNAEVFGIAQFLASGCVIELSMLLRKKQPSWVQTFVYFSKFLYNVIMDVSSLFNRCEVITHRYFGGSLKEGAKEDRGSRTALLITFDDCSEIPSNFISKFLSNVTNKTNLNKNLASKFLGYHEGKQSILCVTFGDSIISNSEAVLSEADIN